LDKKNAAENTKIEHGKPPQLISSDNYWICIHHGRNTVVFLPLSIFHFMFLEWGD
jgi:hypothetical protein